MTDDVITKVVALIAKSCSSVAWSQRRHVIKSDSKVISTSNLKESDDTEDYVVILPALHRLMGIWEMVYRYKTLYPSKNDRIKDDAFNRVATRLTQTQQKVCVH